MTPWMLSGTSWALHRRALGAGAVIDPEQAHAALPEHAIAQHAIVVGAGPAGQAVVQALADAGVPLVVIEFNRKSYSGTDGPTLPTGARIVFGDAARPEVLMRANVSHARIVVVTIPDPTSVQTIVAQVGQLAPRVPVVARGRYHRYVTNIASAGAAHVVDEEELTGHRLADAAIAQLAPVGAAERRHGERRSTDPSS
jgi:CPA2 family monovalent cation:H+ antiporter-2